MIVLIHVLIALSSLLYAGYLIFRPSKLKITISYALIAATLSTGMYLVYVHPSQAGRATITGSVYLAVIFTLTRLASKKVAAYQLINDQ